MLFCCLNKFYIYPDSVTALLFVTLQSTRPAPFLPPASDYSISSKPQLSIAVPTHIRERSAPCTGVCHPKPVVGKQGRLLLSTRGRLCCPRTSRVAPARSAWGAWTTMCRLLQKRVELCRQSQLLLRTTTLSRAHGGRVRYELYFSTARLVVWWVSLLRYILVEGVLQ